MSRASRRAAAASPWEDALRRLRRNSLAMVGLGILLGFALASALAPWITSHAYDKTNLPYGAKAAHLDASAWHG